ncbi:alpha/beta hydrolase [Lyngbya aestuarii]|uniref:alpha/beta hydrolase n=1 Tax=Lyngbya aestuarii TaxID=118322 RepID=UPI00403D96FE
MRQHTGMSNRLLLVLRLSLGFVTLMSAAFSSTLAEAAESVVLKYRFLQETVSVPELSEFAQTGQLSPALSTYLRMANKEPEQLRGTLTREIHVDPILLSKALNSPVGELMLGQVSEVIHTPSNRANIPSLRSALVSSALPDQEITLIEILENYPTPEVHVNGERLVEVMEGIRKITGLIGW